MFETFRVLTRLSNQLSCLGLSWWHPSLRNPPSSALRLVDRTATGATPPRWGGTFFFFVAKFLGHLKRWERKRQLTQNRKTLAPSGLVVPESFCGCWVGFVAESCDCISSLPWSFWKAISNQGRVEYVFRSCCLWNGGMRFLHARVLAPTRFSPPGLPEDCVSLRCFRCVGYTTQITMLQPPLDGFVSEKNIEFILRNSILDVLHLAGVWTDEPSPTFLADGILLRSSAEEFGDSVISLRIERLELFGGFLKWWYQTTMGFPTKNDHFGVFWGYHHLRKHPLEPHWHPRNHPTLIGQ